jgi:hypothetical protein
VLQRPRDDEAAVGSQLQGILDGGQGRFVAQQGVPLGQGHVLRAHPLLVRIFLLGVVLSVFYMYLCCSLQSPELLYIVFILCASCILQP